MFDYEMYTESLMEHNGTAVNITLENGEYSADKTYSELLQDFKKNKSIYAVYDNVIIPLKVFDNKFYFYVSSLETRILFTLDEDNEVELIEDSNS